MILALLLEGVIPAGKAWIKPLQERDSVLIADQFEYGFQLDSVKEGTVMRLADFSPFSNDTLTLVRGWKIDTLKYSRKRKEVDVRGTVVLATFEEGHYELPPVPVLVNGDTLLFEGAQLDVKTIPVDTTTFEIHDLKGQITYPVTFREVLPWAGGALLLAALIALAVWLIRRKIAEREALEHKEPAYIVALRALDKFRSDKYWEPEKQKTFYSGITDALKFYIEDRFGVDAPEMTTAELFDALKSDKDISPDLYLEMKELFERADFVKFAKFIAPDEDNAKALPCAVRFVTSTYQTELENDPAGGKTAERAAEEGGSR